MAKKNKKIIRVISDKKKSYLGETKFDKNNKPTKVIIYKKSHGKDKKKESNRMINTIVHEEYHVQHPNAAEKQTYKATSAKKVKAMPANKKHALFEKFYHK